MEQTAQNCQYYPDSEEICQLPGINPLRLFQICNDECDEENSRENREPNQFKQVVQGLSHFKSGRSAVHFRMADYVNLAMVILWAVLFRLKGVVYKEFIWQL
jgi:hypothetical protein